MSASEAVCLVGWGAIGSRVAKLLEQRQSSARIVAVAVRDAAKTRCDLPKDAALIERPDQLGDTGTTLVVEAAGRASVESWGLVALAAGMDFAVSSTSAFVDDGLLSRLLSTAEAHGARLLVPPGALGGMDALAAAGRLPIHGVEHRIIKPAKAWAGTRAHDLVDLEHLAEPVVFYSNTARAAADMFPQNANAAVITALAGIGLDKTLISLVADPAAKLNTHEIVADGDFGRLHMRLENRPLATNPKSSEMTALNLVRLIENRVTPLAV